MAQGNNYGQSSNGVADESPNMLVYRKVSLCIFQKLKSWTLLLSMGSQLFLLLLSNFLNREMTVLLFEMVKSALVNFASCSEAAAFQFEIFDVFQSLSALMHMVCDGDDVPEPGPCFEVKCSLLKFICKINSYVLKLNINCTIQYFCLVQRSQNY